MRFAAYAIVRSAGFSRPESSSAPICDSSVLRFEELLRLLSRLEVPLEPDVSSWVEGRVVTAVGSLESVAVSTKGMAAEGAAEKDAALGPELWAIDAAYARSARSSSSDRASHRFMAVRARTVLSLPLAAFQLFSGGLAIGFMHVARVVLQYIALEAKAEYISSSPPEASERMESDLEDRAGLAARPCSRPGNGAVRSFVTEAAVETVTCASAAADLGSVSTDGMASLVIVFAAERVPLAMRSGSSVGC